VDSEEFKEFRERCAASAALALYNSETQFNAWRLERPTSGHYEFDIIDATGQAVGAIEVKRIVEPYLNKESALGRLVERVAGLLKGKVHGTIQILHVNLEDVPLPQSQQEQLAHDLANTIQEQSLEVNNPQWLEAPLECIVRKTSEQGSELTPLFFGFTSGTGPLTNLNVEPYLKVITAGIKKANKQLAVVTGMPRLLVFDSRSPISQLLGANLLVTAFQDVPVGDYSNIDKVFLVEWPGNFQDGLAGVTVQGFPFKR